MDLGEYFARSEIRLVIINEEFFQRQCPLGLAAGKSDLGVHCDEARSRIGQGVALAEITADGPHVPNSGLSDLAKGFIEQRIMLAHCRVKFDIAMARASFDP